MSISTFYMNNNFFVCDFLFVEENLFKRYLLKIFYQGCPGLRKKSGRVRKKIFFRVGFRVGSSENFSGRVSDLGLAKISGFGCFSGRVSGQNKFFSKSNFFQKFFSRSIQVD